MPVPTSTEARLYYRCAVNRLDDAKILMRTAHTTGAVYLAGYAVECVFKALILSILSPSEQASMLASFRGAKAHDYEWLHTQYAANRGPAPPREVSRALTLVDIWSTDMRYLPRSLKLEEAREFISAADVIVDWAFNRMS